jgi:acetyltransferase-like isoleucine patch superfamily enzyme
MNLLPHCNNSSKPLVLVGSSTNLGKIKDVCSVHGISIAGIIDRDYYGNTNSISGIPVIGTEDSFEDIDQLNYYRDNYNFFCATNWVPENSAIHTRNRLKRIRIINILDQHHLDVISLVDPLARIATDSVVGKGVFIDAFVLIEPRAEIHDYASVYAFTGIGHHTVVMRNCVIQRHCSIAWDCVFEPDTFLGTAVKALKSGAKFGSGTFVHECVYIRRGTIPGEVVQFGSGNLSRVYRTDDQV